MRMFGVRTGACKLIVLVPVAGRYRMLRPTHRDVGEPHHPQMASVTALMC